MMEAILKATGSDVPMTIGGSLNFGYYGAENMISRMRASLRFHVTGSLSLYLSLSEPASMEVQDVHTDGPYSVLAELIGSAAQPVAQPVPRPSSSIKAAELAVLNNLLIAVTACSAERHAAKVASSACPAAFTRFSSCRNSTDFHSKEIVLFFVLVFVTAFLLVLVPLLVPVPVSVTGLLIVFILLTAKKRTNITHPLFSTLSELGSHWR